jgi:hypothetical protein
VLVAAGLNGRGDLSAAQRALVERCAVMTPSEGARVAGGAIAFTRDSGDLCHRCDASPTRGPRLARREKALRNRPIAAVLRT